MERNENLIPVISLALCVLAQNNRHRNVVPRSRIMVFKTWHRMWCPLMDYKLFRFMRKTIHTPTNGSLKMYFNHKHGDDSDVTLV